MVIPDDQRMQMRGQSLMAIERSESERERERE